MLEDAIMKKVLMTAVSLTFLLLTGCANFVNYVAPVKPPAGAALWQYKAPLMVDFNNTSANQGIQKISSKSTHYFHFWLLTGFDFAWGTADIPEIARQRGITEVCYADYEILNILGIYCQFTIHVYGH